MAGPLDGIKRFAGSRNGKIALGGTAVVGVAGLGLMTRHKAGGDPSPADDTAGATSPLPSYLQTTGTSGANGSGTVTEPTPAPSVDPGALEQLLAQQAANNDLLQEAIDKITSAAERPAVPYPVIPTPTPNPAPQPAPPPVVTPAPPPAAAPAPAAQRTYTVVSGDNLSKIAQKFYGRQDWQKIYNANKGVIGGDPNKIKPGQVLVIP